MQWCNFDILQDLECWLFLLSPIVWAWRCRKHGWGRGGLWGAMTIRHPFGLLLVLLDFKQWQGAAQLYLFYLEIPITIYDTFLAPSNTCPTPPHSGFARYLMTNRTVFKNNFFKTAGVFCLLVVTVRIRPVLKPGH